MTEAAASAAGEEPKQREHHLNGAERWQHVKRTALSYTKTCNSIFKLIQTRVALRVRPSPTTRLPTSATTAPTARQRDGQNGRSNQLWRRMALGLKRIKRGQQRAGQLNRAAAIDWQCSVLAALVCALSRSLSKFRTAQRDGFFTAAGFYTHHNIQ